MFVTDHEPILRHVGHEQDASRYSAATKHIKKLEESTKALHMYTDSTIADGRTAIAWYCHKPLQSGYATFKGRPSTKRAKRPAILLALQSGTGNTSAIVKTSLHIRTDLQEFANEWCKRKIPSLTVRNIKNSVGLPGFPDINSWAPGYQGIAGYDAAHEAARQQLSLSNPDEGPPHSPVADDGALGGMPDELDHEKNLTDTRAERRALLEEFIHEENPISSGCGQWATVIL